MAEYRRPMWGRFKFYSEAELDDLKLVADLHQKIYDWNVEDGPVQFKLKGDPPVPVHPGYSTTKTWCQDRGMLQPCCSSIAKKICGYQKERSGRPLRGKGYPNDPRNLFLEEFKEWLENLSSRGLTLETLGLVEQRIRYLELISKQEELFKPSSNNPRTMQQVLYLAKGRLEKRVVFIIQKAIAKSSAREELDLLNQSVRSALHQLFGFLYHIFRDAGEVKITMTDVMASDDDISATSSGFLLQKLVCSPLFRLVFPSGDSTEVSGLMSSRNEFLDEKDKIPLTLLEFPRYQSLTYQRKNIDLENCFLDDYSGIAEFFRSNKEIVATYLKCFGWFQELAKFVLIVEKAHSLAGQGGDLLVYGVANAQLNSMISAYIDITRELRTTIDNLHRIAEKQYGVLVKSNKARNSDYSWIGHYHEIADIVRRIRQDLNAGDDAALKVRMQANSISLKKRAENAIEEYHNFVDEAQNFSKHISGLLGIGVPEASSLPNSVSSLNAIAFNSMFSTESAMDQNRPSSSGVVNEANFQTSSSPKSFPQNDNELRLENRRIDSSNVNTIFDRLAESNENCTKLSLEFCKIDEMVVSALFENLNNLFPKLHSINLSHNELGLKAAMALWKFMSKPECTLRSLDIDSNDIGDEGSGYIILTLLDNHTITELNMANNQINDTGVVSLADTIRGHPSLQFLNLSSNNLTPVTLKDILEAFEENLNIIEVDVGYSKDREIEKLAGGFRRISSDRRKKHQFE